VVSEKVLYGTDLAPGAPEQDWDVIGYSTNLTARRALAIALTGHDQRWRNYRARASELAAHGATRKTQLSYMAQEVKMQESTKASAATVSI